MSDHRLGPQREQTSAFSSPDWRGRHHGYFHASGGQIFAFEDFEQECVIFAVLALPIIGKGPAHSRTGSVIAWRFQF